MKINIDKNWISNRLLYVIIAMIGFIGGWTTLAIALLLTVFQRTVHEFVHAAAVILVHGEIEIINLGPGNIQNIQFSVPDRIAKRTVYGAGVLSDTLILSVLTFILMISGDVWIIPGILCIPSFIFIIAGFLVIVIMYYYHLVPERSDFNLWRKT
jgi:hypothetical protein